MSQSKIKTVYNQNQTFCGDYNDTILGKRILIFHKAILHLCRENMLRKRM